MDLSRKQNSSSQKESFSGVLHLCTNDLQGGAARSAYRLHGALNDIGVSSRMLVKNKQSKDSTISILQPDASGRSFVSKAKHYSEQWLLAKTCGRRSQNNSMFSLESVPHSHEKLPQHSVINLHWITGFIDHIDLLKMLPENAKFVWTLHDINAFSGGCHFPGDCKNYAEECSCCPILESEKKRDMALRIWNRKMRFFKTLADRQVYFVSPSRWLAEAAQASPLLKRCDVSVIPYGIDQEVYCPKNGGPMKSLLGIPEDIPVILVLAARLSDLRKGGGGLSLKPLSIQGCWLMERVCFCVWGVTCHTLMLQCRTGMSVRLRMKICWLVYSIVPMYF